jgi:hypothetical protein
MFKPRTQVREQQLIGTTSAELQNIRHLERFRKFGVLPETPSNFVIDSNVGKVTVFGRIIESVSRHIDYHSERPFGRVDGHDFEQALDVGELLGLKEIMRRSAVDFDFVDDQVIEFPASCDG